MIVSGYTVYFNEYSISVLLNKTFYITPFIYLEILQNHTPSKN